jgi:hypothetical protein
MSLSLKELKEFVKQVGNEAAEDMLVVMGKAKDHSLAKAMIAKAMKAE